MNARGRDAVLPFDWETLISGDPEVMDFFADAAHFNVGRNGISIPVRNRKGVFSVVSFSSDVSRSEWEAYKIDNIVKLQLLAVLIDSAANINSKLPAAPVNLSRREEQCLIWAARGKTYQEIADILNLTFGSVKTDLDTARHKLHCMNLTHAAAVAVATGVIPAKALTNGGPSVTAGNDKLQADARLRLGQAQNALKVSIRSSNAATSGAADHHS